MITRIIKYTSLILAILLMLFANNACKNKSGKPKPTAYFRIDLPEKSYTQYNGECPYSFEYPEYSMIIKGNKEHPCWLSIYFPINDATIYLTYKEIDDNLKKLTENSRDMAYEHTIKATAINEKEYINDTLNVYGILYQLKGNVASNTQFYLTDSTNHFLRGSLYFNNPPNIDSIAPVLRYINKDIQHMIETTKWK